MTRSSPADRHPLVEAYLASLSGKAERTIDAYGRALRNLVVWLAEHPTHDDTFHPEQLTRTALDTYLTQGYGNDSSDLTPRYIVKLEVHTIGSHQGVRSGQAIVYAQSCRRRNVIRRVKGVFTMNVSDNR